MSRLSPVEKRNMNFIKSVEESYDNHGVRNSRETVELEAYKFSE